MLPDRVSNPGPLTYESGALPIALRGPAPSVEIEALLYHLYIKVHLTLVATIRCYLSIQNIFYYV